MFLYKKQVKTRSKVELWDSPMYDYLLQCAKYNLNLLHILKLTDFLQNVWLKNYLLTGLSLLYQLSPINVENVKNSFQRYSNPELASDLIQGLQYGFKLQYSGPRLPIEFKFRGLVGEMALIAREKINKEVILGRVAGLFFNTASFTDFCYPKEDE